MITYLLFEIYVLCAVLASFAHSDQAAPHVQAGLSVQKLHNDQAKYFHGTTVTNAI